MSHWASSCLILPRSPSPFPHPSFAAFYSSPVLMPIVLDCGRESVGMFHLYLWRAAGYLTIILPVTHLFVHLLSLAYHPLWIHDLLFRSSLTLVPTHIGNTYVHVNSMFNLIPIHLPSSINNLWFLLIPVFMNTVHHYGWFHSLISLQRTLSSSVVSTDIDHRIVIAIHSALPS